MKKHIRVLAAIMCILMLVPFALASCNTNGSGTSTTNPADSTATPTPDSSESNTPDSSESDTPDATTEGEPNETTTPEDETTAPPTSDTTDVGGTDKPVSVREVINVKWNKGYVNSDEGTKPHQLYDGISAHSYTDVITIPKAGTKISYKLTDVPSGDLPNEKVYVISSWKQENGTWVIDTEGMNFRGTKYAPTLVADIVPRTVNGNKIYDITYTYVTSKDNENIRLCIVWNHINDKTAPDIEVVSTTNSGKGTKETYDELMGMDVMYGNLSGGLHMAVLGDSYLSGNSVYHWKETYIGLIAQKYGMTVTNVSQGGATFARNPNSEIVALVDRIDRDLGDPDIIVIQGGRNDCTKYSPIGDGVTEDINTVTGAMLRMNRVLKEKYPDAQIVYITAWNSCDHTNKYGLTAGDYANLVVEFCNKMGWNCINAADEAKYGVYINDATYRTIYSNSSGDYSHINPFGNLKVAHAFETRISEMMAGGEADKPFRKVDYADPKGEEDTVVPENGEELEVKWNYGFFGSDKMSNNQDWTLVNGVKQYRYSDIITIPKAGTTIYFKDIYGTKESSTPNTVFIFSSWKKDGTEWVVDKNGNNIRSDQAKKREFGGTYVVWEYTTVRDNESIRLCLRGEDDPDKISVYFDLPKSGDGVVDDSMGSDTIKWNIGYINCGAAGLGAPGTHGSSGIYTYSDVIEVEKSGTKITFKDINRVAANGNYYVFSVWKKNASGEWEFYAEGNNVKSNDNGYLTGDVWSYTTNEDNIGIRVCYCRENDPDGVFATIEFDYPEE